ncbi:MAG TPA: hypothetical protein VHA80_03270 [Solirubrobacterales bacterium]|nr:hypothetical protein [Solirubrobacterales bacterium]
MTNPQQHHNGPTKPQLKLLRELAEETGGTFVWPASFGAARKQIEDLKERKKTSRADRRRETRAVQRDMAIRRGDGARVRASELGGYGSGAHWADDSAADDADGRAGR